jgi:cyclopropane fatty-acyl-phospholipid synthase-like methyltransferase
MSEHVGVLKYRAFAKQVYNLLEDDGIFYLQIAGLRMATQIEDYCWAFFMDKYIFPGAGNKIIYCRCKSSINFPNRYFLKLI